MSSMLTKSCNNYLKPTKCLAQSFFLISQLFYLGYNSYFQYLNTSIFKLKKKPCRVVMMKIKTTLNSKAFNYPLIYSVCYTLHTFFFNIKLIYK